MPDRLQYLLFRIVFFLLYAPIGIMFPFYVLFLKQEVGFSGRQIGYITGISGVAVILSQQLWGYAGDVYLSKKNLVMGNILGAGLLFLAMGEIRSFWPLLAVAFLFYTLFTSVPQLLHGFLFTYERGESRFGVVRAYASLGFVVANLGVGIAADKLTGGRLALIFPLFVVVAALGALLLWPIPESGTAPHPDKPSFLTVQAHFLRRREVRVFLLMLFVYQSGHNLSYILQSVLLAELGADRTMIAFCYSLAAVLELPVFFMANQLRSRFGDVPLMVFAAAVQTVRWAVVWQADTPETIILASMTHSITFGLFYAAAVGFMNRHAAPQFKASAQTMMGFVYFGVAVVVGNFLGGQVLEGGALQPVMKRMLIDWLHLPDRGGLRNLYIFCSALAAVSLFISFHLLRLERRPGRNIGPI